MATKRRVGTDSTAGGATSRKADRAIPRMRPPSSGVKVRMYRTGLGDCFLLCLPPGPAARDAGRDAFYILVDCGIFLNASPRNGLDRNEWMRAIAGHIAASTGRRLDRLVITHEHWDHVSAFHPDQAQDVFRGIQLGQLWLPWTENLELPLAKRLHGERSDLRQALASAHDRAAAVPLGARDPGFDLLRKALQFFGDRIDSNDRSPDLGLGPARRKSFQTEQAMTWLRDEYGPSGELPIRYLHPGEPVVEIDGADDARVYVLGPPESDVLIARYDPGPSTASVFEKQHAMSPDALAATEAAFVSFMLRKPDPDPDDLLRPFDEHLRLDRTSARTDYRFSAYFDPAERWRMIDAGPLADIGRFALQLDSATNNTSLAFALEVGPPGEGKVCLFPGDAMVGNWESWFGPVDIRGKSHGKDIRWTHGSRSIDAADLLRRTALYKVGHHGSHNATLREMGLFRMTSPDLVAMIPVDEFDAQCKAGYGEMPLTSLVEELLRRTDGRVMRNDEDLEFPPDSNITFSSRDGVRGQLPRASFGSKRKTDFYIEYTISND